MRSLKKEEVPFLPFILGGLGRRESDDFEMFHSAYYSQCNFLRFVPFTYHDKFDDPGLNQEFFHLQLERTATLANLSLSNGLPFVIFMVMDWKVFNRNHQTLLPAKPHIRCRLSPLLVYRVVLDSGQDPALHTGEYTEEEKAAKEFGAAFCYWKEEKPRESIRRLLRLANFVMGMDTGTDCLPEHDFETFCQAAWRFNRDGKILLPTTC